MSSGWLMEPSENKINNAAFMMKANYIKALKIGEHDYFSNYLKVFSPVEFLNVYNGM
jgi:hypothetical protein